MSCGGVDVCEVIADLLFCSACCYPTETGIPTQSIFFALTAWASFMACTAVDKLAVKRKGKTVSSRTTAGTSGTVSQ